MYFEFINADAVNPYAIEFKWAVAALSLQLNFSAFLDSKRENADDPPPKVSST